MSGRAEPIRVLVVDDHVLVRQGLAALFADIDDIDIVASCGDEEEALRTATAARPDIALIDIALAGSDGVDLARRVLERAPGTRVVMLTMLDDAAAVDRALRAGARGYVVKGSDIAVLCDAIRAVAAGRTFLSPGVSQAAIPCGSVPPAATLTARESEVLGLVASGFTSRDIADRLCLAVKTVRNHRANIMDKLDVRTTAALVRYAIRSGLVGRP